MLADPQPSTSRAADAAAVVGAPQQLRVRINIPLGGHPSVADAIEACDIANFVGSYAAWLPGVQRLVADKYKWMDIDTVFGYLCFVGYVASVSVVVVHPQYTACARGAAGFLDSPRDRAWGNFANFHTLLIPYFLPGHFALVVYVRGAIRPEAVFYDPLPDVHRLTDTVVAKIKEAVCAFDGAVKADELDVRKAFRGTFNEQKDGLHCGVHICVMAESFLMNGSALLDPHGFDIEEERERILEYMLALGNYAPLNYVRRFKHTAVLDGSDSAGDEDSDDAPSDSSDGQSSMYMLGSQVSAMSMQSDSSASSSAASTASRRSTRSVPRVNYQETRRRRRCSSADYYTPMRHCHKRHGNLGCFSETAFHLHAYYDCGTFGDKVCPFCDALLLQSETTESCCSKGSVKLPSIQKPPGSMDVLFSDPQTARHMLKCGRAYNAHLRFGRLEAGYRRPAGRGAPVVLMNGEIQHHLTNIFVKPGETPAFGQLYLLDPETASNVVQNNRLFGMLGLKKDIFKVLHEAIKATHPLSLVYQNMEDQYQQKLAEARALGLQDVPHVTLVLVAAKEVPDQVRDQSLHPRQVNLPFTKELFAIHVTNDANEPVYLRGTWLRRNDGTEVRMGAYERFTDAAHYPLVLPYGDSGFNFGIAKVNPDQMAAQAAVVTDSDSSDDTVASETASEVDDDLEDYDAQIAASQAPVGNMRNHVSMRQYQRYRLAIRGDPMANEHFLYPRGAITQEYLIDQSFRVERYEHDWLRRNANQLFVTPAEVREALQRGAPDNVTLGKVFRLPAAVKGCPAWYKQKFEDATAIFSHFGRPNFMITLTANPNWREVKRCLPKGHLIVDRPDLLNRIFYARERHVDHLIRKRKVFGKVKASSVTLEFQKRGPPHTHRLIAVEGATMTADFVDEYICAEIPQLPEDDDESGRARMLRALRRLVEDFHVHTCDERCIVNKRCVKGFPKPYAKETRVFETRAALYRRRKPEDGGESYYCTKRKVTITNAHIVPYNPALLLIWGGHCNVEFGYGTGSAKYALKYTFKGRSFAYVRQAQANTGVVDYDESVAMFKGTFRSAPEAHTLIYSWPVVRMSHTVVRLPVHLPGQAPFIFNRSETDAVIARALGGDVRLTYLETFMRQCAQEKADGKSDIRQHTFVQLPCHYRYNRTTKVWVRRRRYAKVIGRLYPVSPKHTERFALYQLVMHVPGPCGWEDLLLNPRTGLQCQTFAEAAVGRGLMTDDSVWQRTLAEAALIATPRRMRWLFATILLYGEPSDAYELWKRFEEHMFDGRGAHTAAEQRRRGDIALILLNRILEHNSSCNAVHGLPLPTVAGFATRFDDDYAFFGNLDADGNVPDETNLPANAPNAGYLMPGVNAPLADYVREPEYLALNAHQRFVVDRVMGALEAAPTDSTVQRLFFMTGTAGTGKTFTYQAIIALCVKFRVRATVTASTGVAAKNLTRGVTLHRAFRLPVTDTYDCNDTPAIEPHSSLGQQISRTQLLIIDEVTMLHKALLEMVDNVCMHCAPADCRKIPFGGKVVLLGGDWQQLLPVVPGGTLLEQADATIKHGRLYHLFRTIKLTQNMRVDPAEVGFIKFLADIGTDADKSGNFAIPQDLRVDSQQALVDFVYGGTGNVGGGFHDKLLLAPTRAEVDNLNQQVLEMVSGNAKTYLSTDTPKKHSVLDHYAAMHDVATLNRETPSGLPPHKLTLKDGATIVLLRNLDVALGLSNGTRLVVQKMGDDLLHCVIASGPLAGVSHSIPRATLEFHDKRIDGSGMHFTRVQFPAQLAFALTINKAQGQTVTKLGLKVDRPKSIFSHGQLFTAASRVRKRDQLKIYLASAGPQGPAVINNVVIRQILDK